MDMGETNATSMRQIMTSRRRAVESKGVRALFPRGAKSPPSGDQAAICDFAGMHHYANHWIALSRS